MIPYQLFLLKTSLTGDKKSSKKIKIFFKRIYRINAVGRCVNMRKCFFPKMAATQSKFFPLYYNRDHSILKCFDILPNFFSPQVKRSGIISINTFVPNATLSTL